MGEEVSRGARQGKEKRSWEGKKRRWQRREGGREERGGKGRKRKTNFFFKGMQLFIR